MKFNKISTLVFLISFYTIFNQYPIQNLEEVSIKKSNGRLYLYEFIEPTIPDGKDAYFFFNISNNVGVSLTITDGDAQVTSLNITSNSLFYKYKIKNLKTQPFIFLISNNKGNKDISVIFIDNSREINSPLEKFLNLRFDSELIKDKPPLPLIFNIDPMEEKTNIYFNTNLVSDNIYDGNSKLEYCERNENVCNYKVIEEIITFEKGKKYKIKYNCNKKSSDTYSFEKYQISYFIGEINFGFHYFSLNYYFKYSFYILDILNYEKFYLYAELKSNNYYGAFITESEKNDLIEKKIGYNSFEYSSITSKSFKQINRQKDYLILALESSPSEKGFFNFFTLFYNIQYDEEFEIEKGTYALINKTYIKDNKKSYILSSSNKNMGFLNLQLNFSTLTNFINLNNYFFNYSIYVDSSKAKTNLKFYSTDDSFSSDSIFENNKTNYYLNTYGPDSLFMRTSFRNKEYKYNYLLLNELEENFYLYIKKYYGNIDFYKYNKELNWSTYFTPFLNSSHFFNNTNEYDIVTNKLLIVSGYQLFTFINSYGSLYDLYFQKVNDLVHIQINTQMFYFNNLVKLLNENVKYYLDFNVDHLIKLDNNFLEAQVIFTDINGKNYVLNKNKRVIRDLKGEGIIVKSNKKALLYFYKKMDNITEQGMIEFDKSQVGKNMKFNIIDKDDSSLSHIELSIVEDFGFKGYYPMLSKKIYSDIDTFFANQKKIRQFMLIIYMIN